MTTSNQLANRIEEVFLNGTWIANTNYKDQLENLSILQVNQKLNSKNTIAALAQHIHYYVKGVTQVFTNGKLTIRDQYSFDFSPITSEKQWQEFLSTFWADVKELITYIQEFPEEKWNDSFVDPKYGTFQRNINGMIEHSYYHLGQIVLLAKQLQA